MFFRQKKSGKRRYLQIVENRWEGGRSKQRVIATLGRLDELQHGGQLDALLQSGAKFSEGVMLVTSHRQGEVPAIRTRRIGAALVFGRIWEQLGLPKVFERLLEGRRFEFSLERGAFLTVLHRLMVSGSDRSCMVWRNDYEIAGCHRLGLHQMYRTMGWLGEPLPRDEQQDATPLAPRCNKDRLEELLFARRRDLFTKLELVFFDTTSIYFEGEGGAELGQYGYSKDHRSDRKQMVVGLVMDGCGRPLCCALWPGNTSDAKTLIPIIDRLKKRFAIGSICIVADRGMVSEQTIGQLHSEQRKVRFILGARMRNVKEIAEQVLSRPGRFREVHGPKHKSKDPSPLKVKTVRVEDRRYVVCLNEDQASKDKADREAILAALEEQLKRGAKSLVGNKGYRKYLKATGSRFEIDQQKVKSEARFDGKWVLRSDMEELSAEEVALQYKQLWMVEDLFRTTKSLLENRPIYHKCDDTIRGHVFCSFLALVLRKELQDRLEANGQKYEWAEVIRDLDALQHVEVEQQGKRFLLRSEARGTCSAVFKAAGVAFPPTVQQVQQ